MTSGSDAWVRSPVFSDFGRTLKTGFMNRILLVTALFVFGGTSGVASTGSYWQQHVDYTMNVDMNAEEHQFQGEQTLVYTNNSPDTLERVFYHLYFNAFQPGSMMDIRSRTIADPDGRVRDRIAHLSEDEIGYQKIRSLKQDGESLNYEVAGTILEVTLNEPIMPGESSTFEMEFRGQVPLQIGAVEGIIRRGLSSPCRSGTLKWRSTIITGGIPIPMWPGSFMAFGGISM